MCLGYRLAVPELKVIIAALIKAFVFEQVPDVQIKNRIFGTLLGPTTVLNIPTQTHTKVDYLPVKVSLLDQHQPEFILAATRSTGICRGGVVIFWDHLGDMYKEM